LAWALAVFMQLEDWADAAHPYRLLVRALPWLVAFNVIADLRFASDARGGIESRDAAVNDFARHGWDGAGRVALHPSPEHATNITRRAEGAGIHPMPVSCPEVVRP